MFRGAAGVLALAVPGMGDQFTCNYLLDNNVDHESEGMQILMNEYVTTGEYGIGVTRPCLDVEKLQGHLEEKDASKRTSWSDLVNMFKGIQDVGYSLVDCLQLETRSELVKPDHSALL